MIRFILIRRAGIGWIAASFDGRGRNINIEVGQWPHIRQVIDACQKLWAMEGSAS